ncbi:MAG: hypothetical protein A3H93_15530 [Rhodocyclales bacterium RIFCSPLOWO2_02_FULL_63_24]|nr:MAG: hypothetical protein A3H93_15530 [Rhodocyclales bacterium RIFCSPLOWO2_02_FULL_63_24]
MPDISYFGKTNTREPHKVFGIKQADRLSHLYAIGKTGTGKSTLLETLLKQDIEAGRGFALIDPHGDLAQRIAAYAGSVRPDSLIYLNAADRNQPFGYNPLRKVTPSKIPLAVSGLLEVFKKRWSDAWGVRMEHVLRNALFALIEKGDATLPDVLRLLTDKGYRKDVVQGLTNEPVKTFWKDEYPKYSFRYLTDAIAPIQNKIGAFISDPILHRLITAPPVDLRFRKIMDDGQMLVVNLAKGSLGEDSSSLLGALLVTTIGLAAFSRADTPQASLRPFYVYLDEFQEFTTLAVANMVSELRKYGIALTLSHQNLAQLEPDVRHGVLGNVGTMIAFRLGPEDAQVLAREFQPTFTEEDLVNLPNRSIYLKLMIDGAPSRAFSATTIKR